jgi:methylmalonyl-CoA mutase cobalamin-binding domain/chain
VKEGLGDIMIVVGGGVPPQDYDALKAAGAEAVEGVAEGVGGHRRGLETVRR